MQKIRFLHLRSAIHYNATEEENDINILLGPREVLHPTLIQELHPKTEEALPSYMVIWTEHADHPKHNISTGDMTPAIVREAKRRGILDGYNLDTVTDDELFNILSTTLEQMSHDNFNVPQYIGICDSSERLEASHADTPEARKKILETMKEHEPYFLDELKEYAKRKNKVKGEPHFMEDADFKDKKEIVETLQSLVSKLKEAGADVKLGGAIINGKPIGIKRSDPHFKDLPKFIQELIPEEAPTPPTKSPEDLRKEVQEENRGKLIKLMEDPKLKKEDIKELVGKMGESKLRNVYPADEVDKLMEYLNLK